MKWLAAVLALLFFAWMRLPLMNATMEQDLWWMLPALSSWIEGKSAWDIAAFILAPAPPALEPPVVKAFLLLAAPAGGLPIRCLLLIAMAVHCASALLLYGLARRCGLARRAAFAAGCFYFSVVGQFHAILWPTAFQHLFAVFSILLLLNLYLEADRRIKAGRPGAGRAMAAALAAGGLASIQRSGLIGLFLVLVEIGIGSRGAERRATRYRRWFPLFALSLFYPVWIVSSSIDGILTGMILHSGLPNRIQAFLLPPGFTQNPVPAGVKYPVLLALGLSGLFGIRALLWAATRWRRAGRAIGFVAAALLLGAFAALLLQDKRQWLFPYNALGPFVTMLASFLRPMQTALGIQSFEPSYPIPPQISPLGVGVSVLLLAVFWAGFVRHKGRLGLFLLWYLVCLVFLLRYFYTALPMVSPSRYLIYLTPFAAVVFGSVAAWFSLRLSRTLRWSSSRSERVGAGVLLVLCAANLAAIPLASWRGKLANTFYVYDDLRAAWQLKENLAVLPRDRRGPGGQVSVEGVEPMLFKGIGETSYAHADPGRYDNLRIAVREAAGRRLSSLLRVNQKTGAGDFAYRIRRSHLLDAQGRRADRFGALLESGLSQMKAGEQAQAVESLKRAAQEKPFLLNYCLAPGLRLEDLRWLTGGIGLREWVGRISARWKTKTVKFDSLRAGMEQELSEYALCLFTLSYLESQQGHEEQSRYWLSQIYWLEPDPDRLIPWISQIPEVRGDPELSGFVQRFKDSATFDNPVPWRKDDYGFERFMVRLLFRWDFLSSWDRRAGVRA